MAQTTQQIIDFINSTSQPNSITGQILAEALNGLIAKSSYAGVAKLATDPGTPEGGAFYIAGEAGTFSHFNNAIVKAGELAVFVYNNGSWLKESVDVASNLGSPDDKADAKGSAFARINKVVDDIGKINTTLTTISQSAQRNYHLELVNALTVDSGTDLVKLAFTPVGEEEPAAPQIGDVLSGKLNTADRLTQYAIIESISQNTVGAPVVTIKYTVDGVSTMLSINTQTWSIADKSTDMPKLVFRWASKRTYYPLGSKESMPVLLIRTNMLIPEGYVLYRVWKSKNSSVHKDSKPNTCRKIKKELRWTRPDAFKKDTTGLNGNLPIALSLSYFDISTNEYVYTTGLTAVDFASVFISIKNDSNMYIVRYKGNGYFSEMPPAPESNYTSNSTEFKHTFGLCFFRRKSQYNALEKMTDVVPIGISFCNVAFLIDDAIPIRFVETLEDLSNSITFCTKK